MKALVAIFYIIATVTLAILMWIILRPLSAKGGESNATNTERKENHASYEEGIWERERQRGLLCKPEQRADQRHAPEEMMPLFLFGRPDVRVEKALLSDETREVIANANKERGEGEMCFPRIVDDPTLPRFMARIEWIATIENEVKGEKTNEPKKQKKSEGRKARRANK